MILLGTTTTFSPCKAFPRLGTSTNLRNTRSGAIRETCKGNVRSTSVEGSISSDIDDVPEITHMVMPSNQKIHTVLLRHICSSHSPKLIRQIDILKPYISTPLSTTRRSEQTNIRESAVGKGDDQVDLVWAIWIS